MLPIILFLVALVKSAPSILRPQDLYHIKFLNVITGIPKIATPIQVTKSNGKITEETYRIQAVKTTHSFLPSGYPSTTIYAYQTLTNEGMYASFPSAAIIAKKNIPTKVIWVNSITGSHILPVDYSFPFSQANLPTNQVPIVPHLHGACVGPDSDGLPDNYFTNSGYHGPGYKTEGPCNPNQAVYRYPNQQDPGYLFFHDHTMSITRLNVYAGMAGLYQIIDNPYGQKSFAEKQIYSKYGDLTKLYFAIADKSFYQDGSLYYPTQSVNPMFTSWVPQFFGSFMTVNGKVWPRVNLQRKFYRMVFLNACQARYLNIFFKDTKTNKAVPFRILRFQGDFLQKETFVHSHLLSPSARIQIILDLSQTEGDVIMQNDAKFPYPSGQNVNQDDKTIMKIAVDRTIPKSAFEIFLQMRRLRIKRVMDQKVPRLLLKQNFRFPRFEKDKTVHQVLAQAMYMDGEGNQYVSGALIGGTSLHTGRDCSGSTYQIGKVYDIHIINLTADTHPIHFHLVNVQKIHSYKFDKERYLNDWQNANGGPIPHMGYHSLTTSLNPSTYRIDNSLIEPSDEYRSFRDVIDAHPDQVTVVRIKFAHNDGRPFSFQIDGARYVWHCHILEHEDNEMMKYFCMVRPTI